MIFRSTEEMPPFLYHYTTLEGFKGILNTGLRFYAASHYPDELLFTFEDYVNCLDKSNTTVTSQYRDNLSSESSQVANSVTTSDHWRNDSFILCFTTTYDNDYLWKGRDVCLCIDATKLWKSIVHIEGVGDPCSIGAVEYGLKDEIVSSICDVTFNMGDTDPRVPFLLISDYVKEEKYRPENEVRAVFKGCYLTHVPESQAVYDYLSRTGFINIRGIGRHSFVPLNLNNLMLKSLNSPFVEVRVQSETTENKVRQLLDEAGYSKTPVYRI